MELIGQHLTVSNSLSFSNSHVYIISPHTTHYCMYSSLCIFLQGMKVGLRIHVFQLFCLFS